MSTTTIATNDSFTVNGLGFVLEQIATGAPPLTLTFEIVSEGPHGDILTAQLFRMKSGWVFSLVDDGGDSVTDTFDRELEMLDDPADAVMHAIWAFRDHIGQRKEAGAA
jgi:hypothetical protein